MDGSCSAISIRAETFWLVKFKTQAGKVAISWKRCHRMPTQLPYAIYWHCGILDRVHQTKPHAYSANPLYFTEQKHGPRGWNTQTYMHGLNSISGSNRTRKQREFSLLSRRTDVTHVHWLISTVIHFSRSGPPQLIKFENCWNPRWRRPPSW